MNAIDFQFKDLIPFVFSFIFSLVFVPIAIRLGKRFKIVDEPGSHGMKESKRVRIHKNVVPRTGGIALYLTFAISFFLFANFSSKALLGIFIGVTFIFIGMLLDDILGLPALLKLLIQIVAGIIAVSYGVKIEFITNLFTGGRLYLGVLSIPLTLLWIVGITNAINLIDGLDGLAGGVSIFVFLSLIFFAYIKSIFIIIPLIFILIGSILGFLVYNYHPAKIFLGDSGAQSLGFLISTISIFGALKTPTGVILIVSIFALSIPIFDTLFAIIRRLKNKKPVFTNDNAHIHHRLLLKGWPQRKIANLYYFITILLSVIGILIAVFARG